MKLSKRSHLAALAAALMGTLSLGVWAQSGFPSQPIKIIVPFTPGTGMDTIARVVAPRLAAEANLVLVSPATTAFARSPATLDSLLAVLGREHRIDATRVYLLGHSMGAGAAAKLAGERPQRVRAAA